MIPEPIYLERTDSTNSVAYSMALKGAMQGTAVIAGEQTEGRGRLGKQWYSPAGKGLYCSLILRPNLSVEEYPLMTMCCGLAVVLALEYLCHIPFGLKWPNDIYREDRKCGGILVESSPLNNHRTERFAVVGCGINVTTRRHEFGPELRGRATSLWLACGREIDQRELFEALRARILEQVNRLEQQGFAPVLEEWCQRDILIGRRLQWVTQAKEVVSGVSLGPDEVGRLHIRDDEGRDHEVLSGEITLAER